MSPPDFAAPTEFLRSTRGSGSLLNSVSAAASACHEHTAYVLLSMYSVIEKPSGTS
jgi:hypothetical protein